MAGWVSWLLRVRFRLVLIAGLLAPVPLLGFLATALMMLETLHRGPRQGLAGAVAAMCLSVPLALLWSWGADLRTVVTVCGALLLAGVALGALLRRVGSLALAYQRVVLFCALGAAVAAAIWPEPGPTMVGLLESVAAALDPGGATDETLRARLEEFGRHFAGLVAAGLFLQLMAALLLGAWWAARMQAESMFGRQFRELRLGRILGIMATLVMISSLLAEAAVIRNLFPLTLFAFWFQGVAVVHAWAWAKRWRASLLAPMYILLAPPFTAFTVLLVASVGLVDNWFELRAPLANQLQRRE